MIDFNVGALIRIRGTKCEGTIKMIEYEGIPDPSTGRWNNHGGKPAFAYVTLNKGMVYPTMRTFNVQTYGSWNLAKVPYEDLEKRTAGSNGDVYALILVDDLTGLKALKPINLNKKPGNVHQKSALNSLGWALHFGNIETVKFMLSTGVPLPDNKQKDDYSKKNALEYLVQNGKLTTEEKLEVIDLILAIDPKIQFGNTRTACAYMSGLDKTLPLLYKIYSKQTLIETVGGPGNPWANLLDSAVACGCVFNAKYLIREGFNMRETVKRLQFGVIDYGEYKGFSVYDKINAEFKKGVHDQSKGGTHKGSLEELIKYAENPDLHVEIEKIKKETAI